MRLGLSNQHISGTIVEQQHEGEPVWIIECRIDYEQLDPNFGELLTDLGLPGSGDDVLSMNLHMTLSQTSGAPLLTEWRAVLAPGWYGNGNGADDDQDAELYAASHTRLLSWNEPLEFPDPQALLIESADRDSPTATPVTAKALLEHVTAWLKRIDALQVELGVVADVDGEERWARFNSQFSRSQGIFEDQIRISELVDNYRLLWNRDGLWISDQSSRRQPVWTPSSPAQEGFTARTVDEFLAAPYLIDLSSLAPLLPLASVSEQTEDDLPVHVLVIETGGLDPDHQMFEAVAAVLIQQGAGSLLDSVEFEFIDQFFTKLELYPGSRGAVFQETSAAFQTDTGPVSLRALTRFLGNPSGGWSRPPEAEPAEPAAPAEPDEPAPAE